MNLFGNILPLVAMSPAAEEEFFALFPEFVGKTKGEAVKMKKEKGIHVNFVCLPWEPHRFDVYQHGKLVASIPK